LTNSKITSSWDAKFKSEKQINKMMQTPYARATMDFIKRDYLKGHPNADLHELASSIMEGFWLAILRYDPAKGGFGSFVNYMCKSYINSRTRFINGNPMEICFSKLEKDDQCFEVASDTNEEEILLDSMTIEKIISELNDDEKTVLSAYMRNNFYIRTTARELKMTPFLFEKKADLLMQKIGAA
jgi:hypothetical protein